MSRIPPHVFLLAACVLLSLPVTVSAQTAKSRDALGAGRRDSTAARDTSAARRDSLRAAGSSSGIDSTVTYLARDSVRYDLKSRTMFMFGKSDIRYRELGMKAENININWTTSLLDAQGVRDTSDTTGKKMRGLPELVDGPEVYHGQTILYDFRTKRGKIDLGKTEMDKSLYYGDEIKKVESDVLFVRDGKFTTCDLEHPHYYFGSPEMKVMVKDKIVARPVYLYIADVPVFALPFGIFPSERGRRSGIIGPAFGLSTRGRYLTHLGYYWAMSDYTDIAFKADAYSGGSYTLYSDFNYRLRYEFEGGLNASFGKVISGERSDPAYSQVQEFNVYWHHNQDFDPTAHLAVNFTFTSGSYYQNTSFNLSQLLLQDVISNATFTKSWDEARTSMTANISRDQNLTSGVTSTVLPDIRIDRAQTFPFRSADRKAGSSALTWYEMIAFTYSGEFRDLQSKTINATQPDSGAFSFDNRRGIQHSFTLNMSPKVGYVTLTPSFNYTEKWYDKHNEIIVDPATNEPINHDVHDVTAIRYYNLAVQASTKMYGMFQPDVFGIKGIRHQLTPSLTYTYAPDFSADRYGYYGRYTDTNRVVTRYGLYDREVFGGAPAGTQQALTFGVGNVFEMKTASHDTSGQDNKFQLLNLNAGITYNFAADSLRFSELSFDYRTAIGQYLTIGGSSTYNLYKFVQDSAGALTGRRINRFLLNTDGRLGDMTNLTFTIGTRFSGEKKKTTAGPIISPGDSAARAQKRGYVGLYDQEAPDFSIPWNLDLNWTYNLQKEDPLYPSKNSGVSATLAFNLTEFWKISTTTSYDLINRVFTATQITVYRDLHCWELNFNWVPTGPYRNFHVEIRLKAPQLQDVKITKQGGLRGIE